ncbi:von Willebrand factor A domain-containing protein 5A-like isoform X8 [Anguilla anguilla]|uniref:von Willebrand factor A domain-containing protein 5A-like isoform X6 n=1 Tax=Anguilla anguilla TaxID=7936 RepID=UPI0015ADC503|nr:von Willebrand factor A domain-containing protein 5A-like isoform X6 [Anguilla anguilla]XP_035239833.1 von Willebrand factor A domain-containing protein 5A-like isoform X8 [Anguilla anguilla]
MVNCCGLLTEKNEPVPLKQVEVVVKVQGHVASVSSTLQYENNEERPLEAIFVFPLEGDAALCHFSAKIGETEVVAELQEKQKAKEQYDDALSSGQQAFLLEESEESSDVFRLSVGSLPPGEKVSVTLTYVTELEVQADEALRFCLPAVLNPRYAPRDTGSVPEVTSALDGSVPYTLSLSVDLSSPSPISKVESNCPLQPLKYLNTEKTQATVSLSPGHKFDRDVELLAYYSGAHQPTAIVEMGQPNAKSGSLMGDPVVMLSLYPEFPAAVTSSLASCGEFLFLVDRSGSMECNMHNDQGAQMRIDSAKDTLLLLLKSLPIGCFFNIYGFGSTHDSFFPKSVEYSQATMDQALEKVRGMKADLGGTEILLPLKHIYSQPCLPEHPRQLFIFTDGEVWNTKDVLDLVKSNAMSHRCFSFGIGEGASTALIKGMAKEGSGHAQFITGTERLQPKVMQSLRFALQPAVKDISVKWNVPKGVSVTPLSPPINVLFQGQRSLLYAQLTGKFAEATDSSVSVQYRLGEQSVQNQLSFNVKPGENTGLTIHRLGARTLIRTLETELRTAEQDEQEGRRKEEAERLKKRVIELSVQSGVSSVLTAFIAVCTGSTQPVQGSLVRRHVPTPRAMPSFRMMGRGPQMYAMACCAAPAMAFCQAPSPPRMVMKRMACAVANRDDVERVAMSGDLAYDDMEEEAPEEDTEMSEPPQPPKDLLLQLISLQKATGSWDLVAELAEVFGKTEEELAKQRPPQVDSSVWATVLALLWLYGFRVEDEDEWQFVAMKAVSWIRAQTGGSVSQCVQAGNALLGCQVQQGTLGL